jgi:hypothetical protein
VGLTGAVLEANGLCKLRAGYLLSNSVCWRWRNDWYCQELRKVQKKGTSFAIRGTCLRILNLSTCSWLRADFTGSVVVVNYCTSCITALTDCCYFMGNALTFCCLNFKVTWHIGRRYLRTCCTFAADLIGQTQSHSETKPDTPYPTLSSRHPDEAFRHEMDLQTPVSALSQTCWGTAEIWRIAFSCQSLTNLTSLIDLSLGETWAW